MKCFPILISAICLAACGGRESQKGGRTSTADMDTANQALASSQKWTWPDSLEAIAIAPESHRIVYEDSTMRILQVICHPGDEEPIHTHRHKSLMWFTQSAHFVYYNYALTNGKLVKKDSTEINGLPPEALNKGQLVDPENPHSIKNVGTSTFVAYRIEYNDDLK